MKSLSATAPPFQYVVTDGSDLSGITKELELPESVEAPVASGDVIGRAVYKLGDRELGTVDIFMQRGYCRRCLQRLFYGITANVPAINLRIITGTKCK